MAANISPTAALDVLAELLTRHQHALQRTISKTQQDLERVEEALQTIPRLEEEHRAKAKVRKDLESNALEVMVSTKLTQQRRFLQLPAKFKFSVPTTHPIRHFKLTQGFGVNWETFEGRPGDESFKFTAEARATWFSTGLDSGLGILVSLVSSLLFGKSFYTQLGILISVLFTVWYTNRPGVVSAGVTLYGRRHEIHAGEISKLGNEMIQLIREIRSTQSDRWCLVAELESHVQDHQQCAEDMKALEKARSLRWSPLGSDTPSQEEKLLQAGDIVGFASALGLKSKVVPKALPPGLITMVNDCVDELRSAKKIMNSYLEPYEWATSGGARAMIRGVDEALELTADISLPPYPPYTDSDTKVRAVVSEFKQDLGRFLDEFEHLKKDLDGKMKGLDGKMKGLPPGPNQPSDSARLEMALMQSAMTVQAAQMQRACDLVRAEKQAVGVAAALEGP